jgi:hypothetical protein
MDQKINLEKGDAIFILGNAISSGRNRMGIEKTVLATRFPDLKIYGQDLNDFSVFTGQHFDGLNRIESGDVEREKTAKYLLFWTSNLEDQAGMSAEAAAKRYKKGNIEIE